MKVNWKIVERVIYLSTILIGIIFYVRDEAKEKAVIETSMQDVSEDVRDIKKKLEKNDQYWRKQTEINGRIIMYIELDSH